MKNIENLPEVTEQVLGGLQADMSLKHRILESAVSSGQPKAGLLRHPAAVLCLLSAAMIAAFALLGTLRPQGPDTAADIVTVSAGSYRDVSPVRLQDILESASPSMEESSEDEETAGPESEPAENEESGLSD